ncbi:cytochrome P450 [Kitasatospora sp. NPDC101235]|uniref:cytochrome P450 n=1 Tax=Kitasatospora sp. NPDC101235 TaxID=3364101 RepID=UPI00382334B1
MTDIAVAPGRLPLLGHAWYLRRQPLPWLRSLYDRGDLVKVYLGPRPGFLPVAPELLHDVLVTKNAAFVKGPFYDKLEPLIGRSLGLLAGEEHGIRRRLVQPAFHINIVTRYFDVVRDETERMTARWRPGDRLALDDEITALMLAVSAKSLFSADVENEAVRVVQRTLPLVMEGFFRRAWAATSIPEKLPTRRNRAFDAAIRDLRRALYDLIVAYRGSGDRGDVLSMLVSARDSSSGQGMTDLQVRDEVIGLLTAACEDIGTTLAWSFCTLAERPVEQDRLRAELDDVLAGRRIEFPDVDRLAYLQRFLNEVLRLRPPWLTTRHTRDSVVLGGHTIPPDTTVLVSPYLQHHNPRVFPDPESFRTDRWLPEHAGALPRGAYVPFGTGAHVCPGRHFSMLVARTVVAVVLSRWTVALQPGARVGEKVAVSIHPTSLPVVVAPR